MAVGSERPNFLLKNVPVLVVEDVWHVAHTLKSTLEQMGMHVLGPTATTAEARRLAAAQKPQLAVVDVNLKQETSWNLINELHEQGVRVIALSGHTAGAALTTASRHSYKSQSVGKTLLRRYFVLSVPPVDRMPVILPLDPAGLLPRHRRATRPKHHVSDEEHQHDRTPDEQHPISIHRNLPNPATPPPATSFSRKIRQRPAQSSRQLRRAYSITSSARASTSRGMPTPISPATCKLMVKL